MARQVSLNSIRKAIYNYIWVLAPDILSNTVTSVFYKKDNCNVGAHIERVASDRIVISDVVEIESCYYVSTAACIEYKLKTEMATLLQFTNNSLSVHIDFEACEYDGAMVKHHNSDVAAYLDTIILNYNNLSRSVALNSVLLTSILRK